MKIEDILISDKEEMKAVWLRCLDTGSWAVGKKRKEQELNAISLKI